MESKIKLFSLNVEGGRHLHRWIPVAKRLNADAICLQEVMLEHLPMLERELQAKAYFSTQCSVFNSAATHFRGSGELGTAILTRHPVERCQKLLYTEQHWPRAFSAASEMKGYVPTSRHLLLASIRIGETPFNVGCVHFTWSDNGTNTIEQRNDLERLLEKASPFKDLILTGDFNIPRSTPLFNKLTQRYQHWIPERYTSSLDSSLFRVAGVSLVVDHLFSSSSINFHSVRYLEGVSDHKAIVASGYKLRGSELMSVAA